MDLSREVEIIINVAAIVGIVYHVGKKEGEILQKVDRDGDNMMKTINTLRMDFVKLSSEVKEISTMIRTREEILRNDIKNERQRDLKDISLGQQNDDRRIKRCQNTLQEMERQLQDKQIYLRLPRDTQF